jgi:hypothetical protein
MAKLNTITVIHTTADQSGADTDAEFELELRNPGPLDDVKVPFINDPGRNERKRGQTDVYQFDVSLKTVEWEKPDFSIFMRAKNPGDDWLPQSIFVLGQGSDGRMILLGNHPQWQKGKFGGTNPTGPDAHEISSKPRITAIL